MDFATAIKICFMKYADFKLMKLEEDNIDDDLSEYNVEINY